MGANHIVRARLKQEQKWFDPFSRVMLCNDGRCCFVDETRIYVRLCTTNHEETPELWLPHTFQEFQKSAAQLLNCPVAHARETNGLPSSPHHRVTIAEEGLRLTETTYEEMRHRLKGGDVIMCVSPKSYVHRKRQPPSDLPSTKSNKGVVWSNESKSYWRWSDESQGYVAEY